MAKKKETVEQLIARMGKAGVQVATADEYVCKEVEVIPTGLPYLDYTLLKCGGIPKGQTVLIWGDQDVGKSWLVYNIIAQAQKQDPDKYAVLVSTEGRERPGMESWMLAQGIDLARLIVVKSKNLRKILPIVCTLAREHDISVICWDTLSNCYYSKDDKDEDPDKIVSMAGVAGPIRNPYSHLTEWLEMRNIPMVMVAQTRANINTSGYGGGPDKRPGVPNQIEHETDIRIRVWSAKQVRDGNIPVGWELGMAIEKGKAWANKGRSTSQDNSGVIRVSYETGRPDYIGMLIDEAIERGLVLASGSWLTYNSEEFGEIKAQGKVKMKEELTEDMLEEMNERLKTIRDTAAVEVSEVGVD